MRNLTMAMLAASMMAGCVSVPKQAVSEKAAGNWHGKSVVLSDRPRAGFVAMTAGKGAFALIGAAAAIESGKTIVEENGIEDPAPVVAHELLKLAQARYGVVAASLGPVKVDTTDVKQLAKAAGGADLLLDVQSLGAQFSYFPTQWGHYWVGSGLVLRVIDVHTGEVLGGGSCHRDSRKEDNPPTKDDLLANKAELLKEILATQRDSCRDELAQKFLPAQGLTASKG